MTCTLRLDEHVAVVGSAGSGKGQLALILARLLRPTRGRIWLNEQDYLSLPVSVTGRRIAYVGPSTPLFTATLRDNLYYGLQHRPLRPGSDAGRQTPAQRHGAREVLATGSSTDDLDADWIDYAAAGCQGPEDLRRRTFALMRSAAFDEDVYTMGLHGTLHPQEHPDCAVRVLQARRAVRAALGDPAVRGLVEPFDRDRYNTNATVAENLLFGTPVGDGFALDSLAEHPYVLHVLDRVGLRPDFLRVGKEVAATMIELFKDLPPGHEFFERYSFISAEDLPAFQPIVQRADRDGLDALRADERARLMALPFRLIVARHRFGLIDEAMQARLVEARHVFAASLPARLRDAVEFFDPERYNAAATIQDNILFGKIAYGQSRASTKVGRLIARVVDELDLREIIMMVGMEHPVGVGGARLSTVQRQKVALVRALLKRPDLLILDEATAGFDGPSQARVHAAIRTEQQGRALVWVVHRAAMADAFDRVLVLHDGQIVEDGRYQDLDQPGTTLRAMVAAE